MTINITAAIDLICTNRAAPQEESLEALRESARQFGLALCLEKFNEDECDHNDVGTPDGQEQARSLKPFIAVNGLLPSRSGGEARMARDGYSDAAPRHGGGKGVEPPTTSNKKGLL